jgi:hypothetical protein
VLKAQGGKMLKRLAVVIVMMMFLYAPQATAQNNYRSELKAEEQKLSELKLRIADQKSRIKALSQEFAESDIALRQELIKIKPDMDDKAYVRESKKRQAAIKEDYKRRHKPLKDEYYKLKTAYGKSAKKVKSLEKKIDRLENDPELDNYTQKVDKLKQDIDQANEKLKKKIEGIYKDADNRIENISDPVNKSKIKKQILSEAKDKELALRKEFKQEKQSIVENIDKVRSAHKEKLAEYRKDKAQASQCAADDAACSTLKQSSTRAEKQKSDPSVNFSVSR